MRDKVLAACRQWLRSGETIVCALSGGRDSVALLHCLLSLREELDIQLRAAHFNHCLRGAESDGDEAFVRQLCRDWNVPLEVGRGDPRALKGQSPEEAARNLRYDFLYAQPGLIATAHHADDQLETVLLNLLRGTGLRGLGGMRMKQQRMFRPMLAVSRAEIDQYLAEHDLPYRQDSSNEENDALRNRLRHDVTPLLYRENPDLAAAVTRMTGLLQQDEAYLSRQTDSLLETAKKEDGYSCLVLLEAEAVLRRRAIRAILPCQKPSMAHVDAVEALLTGTGSAQVHLPGGVTALREYDTLRFVTDANAADFAPVFLRPGDKVWLPGAEIWCAVQKGLAKPGDFAFVTGDEAVCIRPRQTGDALRLSGGTKTVKKWMIDEKIPVSRRSQLPVVADSKGVIGVCGLGMDVTRAAKPGQPAWIVQFCKEGSSCNDR